MKFLSILLIAVAAFSSSLKYPIKRQTIGRTDFIKYLRGNNIDTNDKLLAQYDSGAVDSGAGTEVAKYRYLYSPKWGWIDLKHVSTAIHYTSKWFLSGHDVLDMGMGEELLQTAIHKDSAFSYEDLVSNLLGVYFYDRFIDESDRDEKCFLDNLASYLELLGFSDTPLTVAPNAADIPMDYTLKDFPKNIGYKPMFTKAKSSDLNETDKKVQKYLIGYLVRMEYLDSLL